MKKILSIIFAAIFLVLVLTSCGQTTDGSSVGDSSVTDGTSDISSSSDSESDSPSKETVTADNVPAFVDYPYVALYDNIPNFDLPDTVKSFEEYADLDSLGRCGVAYACIGKDLMPTEDRGSIGQVKPSGWHTVKYDIVDGKYLYNRCHLIGFQLTGENANVENLITGTRYLNVEGMLPFENMVADYIKETNNHVMYRVTPIYDGDALVARGVQMEALSVEDKGDGISFNVYVYNNQPGIEIDYLTGESKLIGSADTPSSSVVSSSQTEIIYVLNVNSKKIHKPSCKYAKSMSEENRSESSKPLADLIKEGYAECKVCFK